MENKRGRKGASVGARRVRKYFSSFTRCSGRGFLCILGVLVNQRHGVMFLLALQCLQR